MDVDEQCNSLIWTCYQHEGLDELKQSLLSTTWELEMTVLSAKEELARRECELIRLDDILNRTVNEKYELQLKCQILQEQNHHHLLLLKEHNNATSISPAPTSTSSGNTEESESNTSYISTAEQQVMLPEAVKVLIGDKPLPEKGRLLQAVMEAGPLLETVLLAGPLPQWDHPPPHLSFMDIPLVSISINPTKSKHKHTDEALIDSNLPTKYQKTQH